ncbi:DJ-1/PfpI family protein [Paenibacillus woosongensis]|uniref:DJ-1/PfpI family protein n=1 Tax=Paenibacillus woosongensis TaxID=307580 RepID=A0A7X3CLK4_9BACL|nr:DJ-1/PfpI family protein [Paenibacillus woosongensis]MUG43724.1 DJ-1/PfpI family protein [Paenibacillus woosongensis]
MLSVQIVLFDGFDLLDAIAPYEVFCAAEMFAGGALSVEFVTAEGPRPVPSGTNGLIIEASGRLKPDRAGILLVPGASGDVDEDRPDSVPAILVRAMNTALTGLIREAFLQQDVIVATVCGGSLLLAMGGLLEGRSAVTHRLGMDLLGSTGAIPIQARVVDDGNLVTGGGVTSGLDVALHLVERELGPRIAHAVEELFEFERRGTVWRKKGIALRTEKELSSNDPDASATLTTPGTPTETAALENRQNTTQASAFDGDWDTTIATPVGKMQVRLSISTQNGIIQGTATQGDETVAFMNPLLQGDKLAWSLQISKPMRLNLRFEVAAEGNLMTGFAKAGVLPGSKLTGIRVS